MISNDYTAAEVAILGTAHDIVCGSIKGILFDDCPSQELRTIITDDVE